MKRLIFGLILILSSVGSIQAETQIPSIIGIWQLTSGKVVTHEGKVLDLTAMPTGEVVIEMQDGPIFEGIYRWQHATGTRLDDGERETNEAEERLLGVFSADGKSFVMADTPDTGTWLGTMLGDNKMELRYVESGPFAAAGYSIMERSE